MRCLCCGKEIKDTASDHEKINGWHSRCIKAFFGTAEMPKLDISEEKLEELANETINKGLTVPGVQKKLSLHLSSDIDSRLTIVDYPTGYILKPQTEEYESLPEFENLAMNMAEIAGIKTVPNALIKNNGQYAYITKRIDRNITDGKQMQMYAMEDFCQLAGRLTVDKYKGSYEKCGRIIKEYSNRPGIDMAELFMRVVFSFVIGNSDMHLKNFSLREIEAGKRKYCMSAAYDILPVNIILPEDNEQMALTLNGKKSRLKKKDFIAFAASCEISEKAAEKMISKLCSLKDKFFSACDESYLSSEYIEQMKQLISDRIDILK